MVGVVTHVVTCDDIRQPVVTLLILYRDFRPSRWYDDWRQRQCVMVREFHHNARTLPQKIVRMVFNSDKAAHLSRLGKKVDKIWLAVHEMGGWVEGWKETGRREWKKAVETL
ncbi:hypothetical protein E2C01_091275 [Portunus trituberculatus]|uniref:Uncharacterized protein n=1 Tax=Portunus trituberculatus TaxID=210409 RepID=A0A5B7JMI5_PORTR|nr:hypothetical protein [Portunus trituberculatus]